MAEKGWIKLHRKVLECWIWQDKPYDKARAWIDLLLLAMHRDKKMIVENEFMIISRGSFMTSILKLSERWGWSRNKVIRFLNVLESEQMLNTKRTPKGTLVTIVKYEQYQLHDTTNDTTNDTTKSTTDDTLDGTMNETTDELQNKNIKNIYKNDKEYITETVDFEKAWNNTFDRYPKKRKGANSKQNWMRRILAVPEDDREQLAIDIFQAIGLYIEQYKKDKPEDTKFDYIPKLDEWLEQDCDYWLRQLEKVRADND